MSASARQSERRALIVKSSLTLNELRFSDRETPIRTFEPAVVRFVLALAL